MEPSQQQMDPRAAASQAGSPHLSSIGWQTPPHPNVGSPMAAAGYVYPDGAYDMTGQGMYYAHNTHRRPQSVEPDQYDLKGRMVGNEVWAGQMS